MELKYSYTVIKNEEGGIILQVGVPLFFIILLDSIESIETIGKQSLLTYLETVEQYPQQSITDETTNILILNIKD